MYDRHDLRWDGHRLRLRSGRLLATIAPDRLGCRAPAVRGWQVCRMHGARGGAPRGNRNGNYKHGARTKEAINAGREVNALLRYIRKAAP